jgi:hypothetical protein
VYWQAVNNCLGEEIGITRAGEAEIGRHQVMIMNRNAPEVV